MKTYVVYSKVGCGRCSIAKKAIVDSGNDYDEMMLGEDFERDWLTGVLLDNFNVVHKMFPHVFLDGEYIGSVDELIDSLM